jgi:alpha-1,6-mannosyltransferase
VVLISSPRVRAHVVLAAIVACTAWLALMASGAPSRLVPASSGGFPDWLSGPFEELNAGAPHPALFATGLAVMFLLYIALLPLAGELGPRAAWAAIGVVVAIVLLGPVMLSRDVFSYIDYARLGTLHHLDPYASGPVWAPHDAAYAFTCCRHAHDVYGPGFTVLTYALVPLGVAGGLWALKLITALCVAGLLAGVAWCARSLGHAPVPAVVFVALNPLFLMFAVGGVHNDVLTMALAVVATALWLGARERGAAAGLAGAAMVKLSAVVLLPFFALADHGRRLRASWLGAAACTAGVIGVAAVANHGDPLGFVDALRAQQSRPQPASVPGALGTLLGLGLPGPDTRLLFSLALFGSLAYLLRRAWLGADPIRCAGWATLAVLLCSMRMSPWYAIWLLPFAALSDDRRLHAGALGLCAFLLARRMPMIVGYR